MSTEIRFVFGTIAEMKEFVNGITWSEDDGPDGGAIDEASGPNMAGANVKDLDDTECRPLNSGTKIPDQAKTESSKQILNYYDPLHRLYFFNGETYGEGAIIWCDIPYNQYIDATFQYLPDDKTEPQVAPLETTKLDRHHPRLVLEQDYKSAYRLAQTKSSPGSVLICRDGRFFLPCTGFYDSNNCKTEYLINYFNVKACNYNSRELWASLVVQVGNIANNIAVKYVKGTEIDWSSVVDYLLEDANSDEYEQPPIKLFDDPEDSFVKLEPPTSTPKKPNSTTHKKSQQSNQTES